ncbi:signal peptidase I [Nocardioides sp. JQ2195]|uniref:signal peptidase I n=1 Tax=Nocardioides sp. JQ2195 TaxID=2592334 RepID=UPI00143EAC33|nr:signal peptidase I [Nocardioides sp. JQ2195]QIX26921.1 signal peptidase I [Nocardioides sp. JQ2195]
MTTRVRWTHWMREGALWSGAVLGALCLVLSGLALALDARPLVFKSGSMSPEIEAGALALAKEVPATELRVGDVVSVETGRNVRITHRIVSIDHTDDGVILHLKGDANPAPDAEAYPVEDAYRVFLDVPWAGHVVNAASTPGGLLLCGAFVSLLLVSAFGRGQDEDASGKRDAERSGSGGNAPDATAGSVGDGTGLRRVSRMIALGTSAAVLLAGGVASAPTGTLATFSDTSQVSSGSITAFTVKGPASVTCVQSSGLDNYWSDARWPNPYPQVNYTAELWRAPNLGSESYIRSIPVANPVTNGVPDQSVLAVRFNPADLPTALAYYKVYVSAQVKGAPTWTSSRVAIDRRIYRGAVYVTCAGLDPI